MHNRNQPIYSLMTLFLSLFVVGCTPGKSEKTSHQVWLPWSDQAGGYRVQKVTVDTVAEWSPLRGSAAQIRSHVIRLDEHTLSSQDVLLEYAHDKSGAIVPLTRFSTEVAAIYANLERMQKLDKELELPEADVARKVYVKFIEDVGGGKIMVNNAFYDASVDSFFVVPFRYNTLPLSVNGAVLAHEHFHSIFARLLLLPLLKASNVKGKSVPGISQLTPHDNDFAETLAKVFELKPVGLAQNIKLEDRFRNTEGAEIFKNRFLNKSILRGLNEGLADVWGWMYSKDPCFMKPSFGGDISKERCLIAEAGNLQLTTVDELGKKFSPWLDRAGQERQAVKYGYELGTSLARLLYLRIEERGELNDAAALRQWARRIVETLPTYLPHMVKVYVEDEMRVSVANWEKMVDTLLFGPGSPSLPEARCEAWTKIIKNRESTENFSAKCK